MANPEHLAILKKGVPVWNQWRAQDPATHPDLSEAHLAQADLAEARLSGATLSAADLSGARLAQANLTEAYLSGATLREANLSGAWLSNAYLARADLRAADLSGARLAQANLTEAHLSEATLIQADLTRAFMLGTDLTGADLTGANLYMASLHYTRLHAATLIQADLRAADLSWADLTEANLSRVCLERAHLVETKLNGANLTGCHVYGISAWNLSLDEATKQPNLVITPSNASAITVDNIEVAQFVYLLLNNQRIRHVINTLTSKVVLILGRFTPERKAVLDALREELRQRDRLPIVFDFEKPASRDLTETITTLARMARFVIADLTDAKSLPQELQAIIPDLPSVPVQPLLQVGARPWAMYEHYRRYPWVLPICQYEQINRLLASLAEQVIVPAEQRANELQGGTP